MQNGWSSRTRTKRDNRLTIPGGQAHHQVNHHPNKSTESPNRKRVEANLNLEKRQFPPGDAPIQMPMKEVGILVEKGNQRMPTIPKAGTNNRIPKLKWTKNCPDKQ
jgi:hypothetical protein